MASCRDSRQRLDVGGLEILPRSASAYQVAVGGDELELAGEFLAALPTDSNTPGLDRSNSGSVRRVSKRE